MYQKRLVILMPLLINEGDFKVRNVTETLNLDLNTLLPTIGAITFDEVKRHAIPF